MLKCILTFVVFVMLDNCANSKDTLLLDKNSNGKEIEIAVESEIEISLDSNPSTGYNWKLTDPDNKFFKLTLDTTLTAESDKLGAPVKQVFRFKTLAPGKTSLNLTYIRSWEKDIAPLDTFNIDIKITE